MRGYVTCKPGFIVSTVVTLTQLVLPWPAKRTYQECKRYARVPLPRDITRFKPALHLVHTRAADICGPLFTEASEFASREGKHVKFLPRMSLARVCLSRSVAKSPAAQATTSSASDPL